MIHFAVIGTNWITKKFIEAAHNSGKLKLGAVYSRTIEQAESFAKEYQVEHCYDSIDELASSRYIDAVYIASPNAFHFQQAQLMLNAKKHVICEKPLVSNIKEAKALVACAKKNKVVLFEAFKSAYIPNFVQIWQLLPEIGTLRKVLLNYCQYSSRYQAYLDGKNPNTFNPVMSSGSLMDIGYYCVASMVALFGEPEKIQVSATLLASGVDAHGSIIADYDGFDVTICHSKVSDSLVPSEIQGERGSIIIENIPDYQIIKLKLRDSEIKDISLPQHENTMQYEAEMFAELVHHNQVEHVGLEVSLCVAKLLTMARRKVGVEFPADSKK